MRERGFKERLLIEDLSNLPPKKRKRVPLDRSLPFPNAGRVRRAGSHANEWGLTEIEERFLRIWSLRYSSPAKCAIEAGYPAVMSGKIANHLLALPHVQRRLAIIEHELSQEAQIDRAEIFKEVLNRHLRIVRAHATEQVHIPPCRYCWGKNNQYQRTYAEFEEQFNAHVLKKTTKNSVPFDEKGGSGYDEALPPNHDCPNCHGRGGKPIVVVQDSRFFTPEQKEAIEGVEETKYGIRIKKFSKADSLAVLSDIAIRSLEYQRPEDILTPEVVVDFINGMSQDQLKQLLLTAKDQGFDVGDDI
jgi:hypothetical protein